MMNGYYKEILIARIHQFNQISTAAYNAFGRIMPILKLESGPRPLGIHKPDIFIGTEIKSINTALEWVIEIWNTEKLLIRKSGTAYNNESIGELEESLCANVLDDIFMSGVMHIINSYKQEDIQFRIQEIKNNTDGIL